MQSHSLTVPPGIGGIPWDKCTCLGGAVGWARHNGLSEWDGTYICDSIGQSFSLRLDNGIPWDNPTCPSGTV